MRKEGKSIKRILNSSAFLRPKLSPIHPKTTPPTGLMTKAAPNTANPFSKVKESFSPDGKKFVAKTSISAPKQEKSNLSMT